MLSIKTNLSSLVAQTSLQTSTQKLNQAIERMSSGYKINRSSDNAANYSISTNMTTKINAYQVAEDNVSMGLDLLTTATDIISTMQNQAARLSALSTQARNGTYGSQSLAALNSEANAIVAEIMRAYNSSEYNGLGLLNRAFDKLSDSAPQAGESGFIDESAIPNELKAGASGFIDESFAKVDTSSMKTLTEAVAEGKTIKGGTWAIGSTEDLVKLAELTNSTTDNTTGTKFVLSDDIDLSSIENWTPIGDRSTNSKYQFKGTFEGNGHVIKNLKIDRQFKDYQGLFGYTASGSKIQNVGLENVDISGKDRVGGLAGYSSSTITNSYTTGDVIGSGNSVGGLVGWSDSSSSRITNSYATGNVSGSSQVGGLVGRSTSTITNSYATGNVSGSSQVGGLAGQSYSSITNSYATGDVSGNNYVGGLVGYSSSSASTITNSYATGNVSGNNDVGGLVGLVYTSSGTVNINNCYSLGNAGGNSAVGSFIGGICNTTNGTSFATINITNCSALTSEDVIGGVFKYSSSTYTEITYDMTAWLEGITEIDPTTRFQVGINGGNSDSITTDVSFIFNFASLKNGIDKETTFEAIQAFNDFLSTKQTELGAVQNRLESALDEIATKYDNLVSSRSTLRDADLAELSSTYIQQQILQQASATLMATANQTPSIALQLI